MRAIVLLVSLLVVALLLIQQLKTGASEPPTQSTSTQAQPQPPAVPTRLQDVQQFGQDMDKFMQDAEQQRRQQIEAVGQ